nr:uncharacterized protein LOC123569364 [Macaca fascicularis]
MFPANPELRGWGMRLMTYSRGGEALASLKMPFQMPHCPPLSALPGILWAAWIPHLCRAQIGTQPTGTVTTKCWPCAAQNKLETVGSGQTSPSCKLGFQAFGDSGTEERWTWFLRRSGLRIPARREGASFPGFPACWGPGRRPACWKRRRLRSFQIGKPAAAGLRTWPGEPQPHPASGRSWAACTLISYLGLQEGGSWKSGATISCLRAPVAPSTEPGAQRGFARVCRTVCGRSEHAGYPGPPHPSQEPIPGLGLSTFSPDLTWQWTAQTGASCLPHWLSSPQRPESGDFLDCRIRRKNRKSSTSPGTHLKDNVK